MPENEGAVASEREHPPPRITEGAGADGTVVVIAVLKLRGPPRDKRDSCSWAHLA